MGQAGPLGRSIDDIEALWKVIRGPDPSDFEIARIDWHPSSGRSLAQLRFAWTDGFEQHVVSAETREQLAALAERIERAGAHVQKAAPVLHPRAYEVYVHLLGALLGQDMPWPVRKIFPMFVARGLLRGQPDLVRLVRRALKTNTREYAAALGLKRMLVEDIERFFGSHDVLLAPSRMVQPSSAVSRAARSISMAKCGPTTTIASLILRHSARADIRCWSYRSPRQRTDSLSVSNSLGRTGRNLSSCTSRGSWVH